MMRITQIELTEIGPFESAVLKFPAPAEGQRGELVIFEGPNGSGKTTIAEAIACAAIGRPRRLRPDEYQHALSDHRSGPHPPLHHFSSRLRSGGGKVAVSIEHEGARSAVRFDSGGIAAANATAAMTTFVDRTIEASTSKGSSSTKLAWAVFAYQGHQRTAVITSKGPADIEAPPLFGALSFGRLDNVLASAYFGQLLVNLDYEEAKALKEASRSGITAERKDELERIATSRRAMLDGIERALSEVLGREVTLEFPFEERTPRVLLDGVCIPLSLLGEGMRSTLAWLADLLVRLHRVRWEDPTRSPLTQDFWLILDEIDESLHPTMQMRILPALRRLFPCARIYLTTHSPFVVASAGEGCVFSIRPDARHQVKGEIAARELTPGQSLEWVVEEIFGAETGFIDAWTRDALRAHRADITRLRRKEALSEDDWRTLLERRAALLALNEQVQTVVAMQEVPVARILDARLAEPPREASA